LARDRRIREVTLTGGYLDRDTRPTPPPPRDATGSTRRNSHQAARDRPSDVRRDRSVLLYASLLVAGAGVVSIYTASVAPLIYPFITGDSAQYLETARHFRAGEGLMVTPWLQQYDADLVPLRIFPPGYPLLIAIVSYLGLPVVWRHCGSVD
jgi:hypothetical protein